MTLQKKEVGDISKIFKIKGPRLVGVSGTNCSGKDTAGVFLGKEFGLLHISLSDVLRAEARDRGLAMTRETLIEINVDLRRKFGQGGVILQGIQNWLKHQELYPGGLVLSKYQVPGEAKEIIKQNGTVIFIDAPSEVRYKRTLLRNRGEEKDLTIEEFIEGEASEIYGLAGPNRPSLRAVQELSKTTIINDKTLDVYTNILMKTLGIS